MALALRPINLVEANMLVAKYHRHNGVLRSGAYVCIGLSDTERHDASNSVFMDYAGNEMVGAVIVGSVSARGLATPWACEVRRLVTDGTKNACSILYGAAWRAAQVMGFEGMITYTLTTEGGKSLRASNWRLDDDHVPVRIWVSRNPKYADLPWSKRPMTLNSPTLPRYRWFIGRRIPSKSEVRYPDDPSEMGSDMPERWSHPENYKGRDSAETPVATDQPEPLGDESSMRNGCGESTLPSPAAGAPFKSGVPHSPSP